MTDQNENPPAPPPPRTTSLKALFEANTVTAAEGGVKGQRKEIPRTVVEITVDKDVCAPGVFPEDFEITLRSTTGAIETRLAKAFKNDALGYQAALIKASIYMFNGAVIGTGEDEWLWEALGPAGRNLITVGWQSLVVPSEEAQGKASRSLKITG